MKKTQTIIFIFLTLLSDRITSVQTNLKNNKEKKKVILLSENVFTKQKNVYNQNKMRLKKNKEDSSFQKIDFKKAIFDKNKETPNTFQNPPDKKIVKDDEIYLKKKDVEFNKLNLNKNKIKENPNDLENKIPNDLIKNEDQEIIFQSENPNNFLETRKKKYKRNSNGNSNSIENPNLVIDSLPDVNKKNSVQSLKKESINSEESVDELNNLRTRNKIYERISDLPTNHTEDIDSNVLKTRNNQYFRNKLNKPEIKQKNKKILDIKNQIKTKKNDPTMEIKKSKSFHQKEEYDSITKNILNNPFGKEDTPTNTKNFVQLHNNFDDEDINSKKKISEREQEDVLILKNRTSEQSVEEILQRDQELEDNTTIIKNEQKSKKTLSKEQFEINIKKKTSEESVEEILQRNSKNDETPKIIKNEQISNSLSSEISDEQIVHINQRISNIEESDEENLPINSKFEDLSELIKEKIPLTSTLNSYLNVYKVVNNDEIPFSTDDLKILMDDFTDKLKILLNKESLSFSIDKNNGELDFFYKYDKKDLNEFVKTLDNLKKYCTQSNDLKVQPMTDDLIKINDNILNFEERENDFLEFLETSKNINNTKTKIEDSPESGFLPISKNILKENDDDLKTKSLSTDQDSLSILKSQTQTKESTQSNSKSVSREEDINTFIFDNNFDLGEIDNLSDLIKRRIPLSKIKNSNLDLYKILDKNGPLISDMNFIDLMNNYNQNLISLIDKDDLKQIDYVYNPSKIINTYKFDENDFNYYLKGLDDLKNYLDKSNDLDANEFLKNLESIKNDINNFVNHGIDNYPKIENVVSEVLNVKDIFNFEDILDLLKRKIPLSKIYKNNINLFDKIKSDENNMNVETLDLLNKYIDSLKNLVDENEEELFEEVKTKKLIKGSYKYEAKDLNNLVKYINELKSSDDDKLQKIKNDLDFLNKEIRNFRFTRNKRYESLYTKAVNQKKIGSQDSLKLEILNHNKNINDKKEEPHSNLNDYKFDKIDNRNKIDLQGPLDFEIVVKKEKKIIRNIIIVEISNCKNCLNDFYLMNFGLVENLKRN